MSPIANAFLRIFNGWSRTVIAAWLPSLAAALSLFGIDLPLELILEAANKVVELTNSLVETTDTLILLILGPLFVWLRTLTSSPVMAGLWGWLGRKPQLPDVVGMLPGEARQAVEAAGFRLIATEDIPTRHGAPGRSQPHVTHVTEHNGAVAIRVVRPNVTTEGE